MYNLVGAIYLEISIVLACNAYWMCWDLRTSCLISRFSCLRHQPTPHVPIQCLCTACAATPTAFVRLDAGVQTAAQITLRFTIAWCHPCALIFLIFCVASNDCAWSYKNLSTQACGEFYVMACETKRRCCSASQARCALFSGARQWGVLLTVF